MRIRITGMLETDDDVVMAGADGVIELLYESRHIVMCEVDITGVTVGAFIIEHAEEME